MKPWFRPPYGSWDASVKASIGRLGYRYNVIWTVDSGGWTGLSVAEIRRRTRFMQSRHRVSLADFQSSM